MKNIFKFMGLALIAGSLMFTACKKDDDTDNNDTTNQTPSKGSYTITWNGQAQTGLTVSETQITDVTANFNGVPAGGKLNYFQHVAAAGTQDQEYVAPIYAAGIFQVSGCSGVNIPDGCYAPEDIVNSSNYSALEVIDAEENLWAVQEVKDGTGFTAFDATTNAVTGKLDIELYDYYEWMYAVLDAVLAAHPELGEGEEGYEAALDYINNLEDEMEFYEYLDAADEAATSRATAVVNYDKFVFSAHK